MSPKIISRIVFWLMGIYQGYLVFATFGPGLVSFAISSFCLGLTYFMIAYGLEKDELWAAQAAVGWGYGKFLLLYVLDLEKPTSDIAIGSDAINIFGFIGSPSNTKELLLIQLDRWILPLIILLFLAPRKPGFGHLKSLKVLKELLHETFGNKYFVFMLFWTFTLCLTQVGGYSRLERIKNSRQTLESGK